MSTKKDIVRKSALTKIIILKEAYFVTKAPLLDEKDECQAISSIWKTILRSCRHFLNIFNWGKKFCKIWMDLKLFACKKAIWKFPI